MKKTALILAVVLAALCTLCGCGSKNVNVNLNDVMTKISSEITLPEMTSITDASQFNTKYGITEDMAKSFVAQINAGGVDQDEIVMVEATSADNAKAVADKLQARLDSKAKQCKDYLPEQYEFVSKSKVNTNGNYVSMFVSKDQDKMTEIYNSFFK